MFVLFLAHAEAAPLPKYSCAGNYHAPVLFVGANSRATMVLEGQDVVKYLSGRDTVRDGALVSFVIQNIGSVEDISAPVIELVFHVPQDTGVRIVKLELRDIQEFSFAYTKENPPDSIGFVKCLWTEDDCFYLSLDPYDEWEAFISEEDNDFFRAKSVKLSTSGTEVAV